MAQLSADSAATSIPVAVSPVHHSIGAADTLQPYYYRLNGTYLKSYVQDLGYVASRPFHWKGRDWGKAALIGGSAALLLTTTDWNVRNFAVHNQHEPFITVGKVVEPFGNRLPPLLLAGMYVTGVVTHNRRVEHAALSITRSVVVSTAIYLATKTIVRRQRPVRTDNPYDFAPPFTHNTYTSFPSGHSNTAFAVATAFALEYKDKKWVPWMAYSLATLTAVSRLYQSRHWSSDVLIGASIGHFVTKAVYAIENKKRANLKMRR